MFIPRREGGARFVCLEFLGALSSHFFLHLVEFLFLFLFESSLLLFYLFLKVALDFDVLELVPIRELLNLDVKNMCFALRDPYQLVK